MDIRTLQEPLEEAYGADPETSRITPVAAAAQGDAPELLGRGGAGPARGRGPPRRRVTRRTGFAGAGAEPVSTTVQMPRS